MRRRSLSKLPVQLTPEAQRLMMVMAGEWWDLVEQTYMIALDIARARTRHGACLQIFSEDIRSAVRLE